MIKYYYVRFKYLKSERAELITAAKTKGVIFQLQKMYDKSIEIIKLVEISKEKYDRLTLWHELRYGRPSYSKNSYTSSYGSGGSKTSANAVLPLLVASAFMSATGADYYSQLPVNSFSSSNQRRRGKGRG